MPRLGLGQGIVAIIDSSTTGIFYKKNPQDSSEEWILKDVDALTQ